MTDTTFISNRYRLFEKIGEGGMGTVYRVEDRLNQQVVALKQVLTDKTLAVHHTQEYARESGVSSTDSRHMTVYIGRDTGNSDESIKLAYEFRFLASLRHPNIISVLDFGFDAQNRPYFTMDWLENARTILDAASDKDTTGKVELVIQMLYALVYLHRRGIVHRDLKPGNILVTEDEQVKVLDFGLSEYTETQEDDGEQVAGTLAYLAPELLIGEALPSPASDLYAIGTVMYEMFIGQHPFDLKNVSTLITDVMYTLPDLSSLTADDLTENISPVIERLLLKSPSDRYQNASNVIIELAEIIDRPELSETADTRNSLLQSASFVGRDAEMNQLKASWRNTLEQKQAALWFIGGESGIGKSRMMDEIRIYGLVNGAAVIRGQAVNKGGVSYQLWRDVARNLMLQEHLSELDQSILKVLVPDANRIVGHDVPDAPDLDASSAQQRLQRLLVRLIDEFPQPMLLIMEDLQWTDDVSLALLDRVINDLADKSIMIVANYRDNESPELPAMFETGNVNQIKLERLPKEQIAALTNSMLGDEASQEKADLIELLHRETAGNAFFVVEVIRSLAEAAGSLDNIMNVTVSADILNANLDNIIRLRLERFPAKLQPLLRLAAVQGREIDMDVLQHLASSAKEIEQLVSVAIENNIFTVQGNEYQFAHDKIREGLLDTLIDDNMAAMHETVATAIEVVHQEYIDDYAVPLAYHWRAAGSNKQKEATYAASAGIQLYEGGSYKDAIPQLQHALSLYASGVVRLDAYEQATLERTLGEVYFADGQMTESKTHLEKATKLLNVSYPGNNIGLVLGLVGEVFKQIGHRILPKRFFVSNKEAEMQRVLLGSVAYERISHIVFFANRTIDLLYASLRSLNLAENAPPSDELARGYGTICYTIGLVPIYPLATYYEKRAYEITDIVHKRGDLVDAWVWEITAYYRASKGELNEAVEFYSTGQDVALEIGHLGRWAECSTLKAMVLYQQGKYADSRALRQEVLDYALRTGNQQAMGWSYLGHAEDMMLYGDLDEAEKYLNLGTEVEHRMGVTERAWMYGMFARLQSLRGDYAAMKASVRAPLDLLKTVLLPNAYYTQEGYTGIAETLLAMSMHPDKPASDDAQIKKDLRASMSNVRAFANVFPASRAHVNRIKGWHAWLNGKQDKARQHWSEALMLADSYGKRWEKGLVYYDMGRFLKDRDALQKAHTIFSELDSAYYVSETEKLLNA